MSCDLLDLHNILIICPAIARYNWDREFKKWSYNAREFTIPLNLKEKPTNLTICSYDYARHNYQLLKSFKWDVLILDEGHMVKSTDAKVSKAIWGVDGIVRSSARVWFVSGTPAPNHVGELWILLYSFGATKLKYDEYVTRYCTYYTTQHGLHITGTNESMIHEVREMLKPFILRRKKEDVMKELPPIFYQDVALQPAPLNLEEHSHFIEWVVPKDRSAELKAKVQHEESIIINSIKALDQVGKDHGYYDPTLNLWQTMSIAVPTVRRYVGQQKVQSYVDYVYDDLLTGKIDKLVVFALHRDVIEELRVKLLKFGAMTLYGGSSQYNRERNIRRFQTIEGKFRVLICNVLAAGTSITLTKASRIDMVELSSVPGHNAQAIMRVHRIGQEKTVFVRIFSLVNSFDERINTMLMRKIKQLTKLYDDVEEKKLTETNLLEKKVELKNEDEDEPIKINLKGIFND